jgi:EAL domain-containing protein (putative c-di-GMP-specific phosphodiesterase class I)
MSCGSCSLPEAVAGRYNIYFWSSPLHVLDKIQQALHSEAYFFAPPQDGGMLELGNSDIGEVIDVLSVVLSPSEKAAVKILLFRGPQPSPGEYGSVTSFDRLCSALESQWLLELLKEGRYKSVVQPIVSASGPAHIFAYEFLLRGIDSKGAPVPPIKLFEAATNYNLMVMLDRVARHCAITTAARLGIQEKLFINFMPAAIYDPTVCLKPTFDVINAQGFKPENVVFEIVESEVVSDIRHLRDIVAYFRQSGFPLALDDFGAGFNNLGIYLELKPDYIKLDKQLTDRIVDDQHRREMVGGFIASAQRNGAKIIAEGIEDQHSADILKALGVDFLQGYYFGYPSETVQPASLPAQSGLRDKISRAAGH